MQFRFFAFLLGEFPRLLVVHENVCRIGQGHHLTQRPAEFTRFIGGCDIRRGVTQGLEPFGIGGGELAVEFLADEAGAAAGDIDVLADEVGIDAGDEVVKIQVNVFHRAVELGGVVVAQPLGVEAGVQVALGGDESTARLAHFGAVDGQETMHEQTARRAVAGVLQLGRPEQCVEVEDVLANEVVQLSLRVRLEVFVEIEPFLAAQVLERTHVADRRIEPDVEILARRVGDLEAEIGCVARDVPVGELVFAFRTKPFLHLVRRFRLQMAGFARPAAQEALARIAGELEEVMIGISEFRRGTGDCGIRVFQFVRRISRAAGFTVVPVLVLGTALRAFAFDEAIRQKHLFDRIVVLLDGAFLDQFRVFQSGIDFIGAGLRFRRMRAVEVVEGDMETGEIP